MNKIILLAMLVSVPGVYAAISNQTGWPVPTGFSTTSPVIGDLDGNFTNMEIVISRSGGMGVQGALHVYNSSGGEIWKYRSSSPILSSPALGDINNDGDLEVVVGSDDGTLHVFHSNGSDLYGWPQSVMNKIRSAPALSDLDNDMSDGLEIIVGSYDGKVYAWYSNGTLWWSVEAGSLLSSSPAVGDIDGDSDLEVVIGSEDGWIYAFHHDGFTVQGWPVELGGKIASSPAIGDIDGDGDLEVVVGWWGDDTGKVYAFHHDGSNVENWPKETAREVLSSPALGDLDGDGYLEVVVGDWSGTVYAWYYNGTPMWNRSTEAGSIYSSPAVGDIDGDGKPEIVVGLQRSTAGGRVYAWHYNGSLVSEFPLNTSNPIDPSPALGDIDGDGDIELVVGSSAKGDVYVWDLEGAYNHSNMEWRMFRHDPLHTGLYHPITRITSPRVIGAQFVYEDSEYYLNINETVYYAGESITFNSSCMEQDGNITSYSWVSSINGSIGSTSSFVSTLNRGAHRVNLTIINDRGIKGLARANVYVGNSSVSFSDNTDLFEISNSTGVINFTPNNSVVGVHLINITITDVNGVLGYEVFNLTIINTNDPPTINTTHPPQFVDEDSTWAYDFNASDDDVDAGYEDTLAWSVNNTNITIDSATGVATWTPTNDEVGNHTINVSVVDSGGVSNSVIFNINVNNTNDPPVLDYIGPQYAVITNLFYFDVNASDPDWKHVNDTLTFSDNSTLFEINSSTGLISFTPDNSTWGAHEINISVRDSGGEVDSTVFTLTVDFDVTLLQVWPDKQNYYLNENVTITAETRNLLGTKMKVTSVQAEIKKINDSCQSEWIDLEETGVGVYTGSFTNTFSAGVYNVTIYAHKTGFNSTNATMNFTVYPPTSWSYRMPVNITAESASGNDLPVKIEVNFTEELQKLNVSEAFDANSIRVYEFDSAGNVLREVPSQFEEYPGEVDSSNIASIDGTEASASAYTGTRTPSWAINNDFWSDWACDYGIGQNCSWWKVDLDSKSSIGVIHIHWHYYESKFRSRWAVNYTLSVSDNNIDWTIINTTTGNNDPPKECFGGCTAEEQMATNEHTFLRVPTISGRYINLSMSAFTNIPDNFENKWVAIREFEVYSLKNSYNASTNAVGNLTWILDNEIPANGTRYYEIRFDTIESAKEPPIYNISYSSLSMTAGLVANQGDAANNSVPSALLTAENSTLRNVPLTFNATDSSDPDDDNLTYFWYFDDCSGATGATVNHTYTALTQADVGIKNVTLTVYDGKGGSDLASIWVNVTNNPPILNISNLTLTAWEDTDFYYDVNVTEDPDPLNYSDNATFFDIEPTTGVISFIPNNSIANQNYSINISVSDGLEMDSTIINFEVINVNDPPVLDFISTQTAIENQTLIFYVNASDDDLIHWDNLTFGDNSTDFNITKVSNTTAMVNWTPSNVTENKTDWVNFTVTDLSNATASQIVPITVIDGINEAPVIEEFLPENETTINETDWLNISISAWDPNGGPPTIEISLYNESGKLKSATGNQMNYTWKTTYDDAGEYTFTASVTDGINTTSLIRTYRVLNVNRPPNITITSPTNGTNIECASTPCNTDIITNATDPDGDNLTLSISIDGTEISDNESFTYDWSSVDVGVHTITAKATDPYDDSSSTEVTVVVSRPDLTLNITFSDDDPIEGQGITIDADIYNLNNAGTGYFYVDFYLDDTFIDRADIKVSANSSSKASVNWVATHGSHTIKAVADSSDIVIETNESNNVASTTIYVRAKPDLAISPSDINLSSSNPTEGDNVTIRANVRNINETAAENFKVELRVDGVYEASKLLSVEGNSLEVAEFTWTAMEGVYDITIALDSSGEIDEGNESNNEATVQIEASRGAVDMTPPTINITSPINGSTISMLNNMVTGNITDRSGMSSITLSLNGATVDTWYEEGTFSRKLGYTVGWNEIRVTAKDRYNNTAEEMISVQVVEPVYSKTMQVVAGEVAVVDGRYATDTEVEFESKINGTVNITIRAHTDISGINITAIELDDSSVDTSYYGAGRTHKSISGYREVVANITEENLSWVALKVYYNDVDLDKNEDGVVQDKDGDGYVGDDPGDINENSLKLYWYCSEEDKWYPVVGGRELPCSGPRVYDEKVYEDENYVWANLSHFSIYGMGGSITESPGGDNGGGGGGGTYSCLKEGLQSLESTLWKCILTRFNMRNRQFYTDIETLAGVWPSPVGMVKALASILAITGDRTGEYPAPEIDVSTYLMKPVKVLEGDVYSLAVEKVQKRWAASGMVVIARGDLQVDSLAAIAYAKARGMPILLTKPNELPSVTLEAVKKLGPRKIIIVGGSVAVSEEVEAELAKLAAVERIAGANREETAVKLANAVDDVIIVNTIVVANGLDASTDAAIIAAAYKAPIVYVSGGEISQITKDYLVEKEVTAGYVRMRILFVGISESVQEEIKEILWL